jgi:hypothetical protein
VESEEGLQISDRETAPVRSEKAIVRELQDGRLALLKVLRYECYVAFS